MTRTSFFNHATITILATLLVYAPLTSCAPGADGGVGGESDSQRPMVAREILRLACTNVHGEDEGKAEDCSAAVDPMFDAALAGLSGNLVTSIGAAIDFLRVDDRDLVVEAARSYAARTNGGTELLDVVLSTIHKLGWRNAVSKELTNYAAQFLGTSPVPQGFYLDIFETLTGSLANPDDDAAEQVRTVLAEYNLPVYASGPDTTGAAASLNGLNQLETAQASNLGNYRGAEQAGLILLLLLALVALTTACVGGGVTSGSSSSGGAPIDLNGDGIADNPAPLATPQAGSGATDGTYSATPQFTVPQGTRDIWPTGGWINTINQRWQRAAGGRANPDRGNEVERGLAAIEDLFETAPDGFTYASVYAPIDATNLPWIKPQATNWFVDIPGSPKLGPHSPEQREVTFAGDATPYTVFWFVVSSQQGKASMLTDILGDEQGANNPLTFRSGTKPLLVFTSLEARGENGEDRGHHITVGPVDPAWKLAFTDVPGVPASAPIDGYPNIRRLGAGAASDGQKVTAQPYAVITAQDDSPPTGDFDFGFGYIGSDRPGLNFDFHVTFQAR